MCAFLATTCIHTNQVPTWLLPVDACVCSNAVSFMDYSQTYVILAQMRMVIVCLLDDQIKSKSRAEYWNWSRGHNNCSFPIYIYFFLPQGYRKNKEQTFCPGTYATTTSNLSVIIIRKRGRDADAHNNRT